jgi:hypothetical protein
VILEHSAETTNPKKASMKLALIILTVFTAISMAPVHAAGKGAKGKKKKSEPSAKPQPAAPKSPSEELGAFLGANLDRLLAPLDTGKGERDRDTSMKAMKIPVPVRAEVTTLDQRFRASASAATPAEQPVFQRAVGVTTGLTQLIDERDRQTSRFINSRTTRPLSDLAIKKTGKQRKDARQEAHETKNFMSSGLEQQWLQTAARYRQQINAQMESLRAAERQAGLGPPAR